jgi:DNA-binding NarL/FixJ family response regulator
VPFIVTKEDPAMVNILLVDDHPIVRQGLARVLMREPDLHVCGEAEDEAAALRLVAELLPQLVIVDLSLKSGDGIALIKTLRASHPAIPVLVLSMHDESHFVERALRAGALGYLTKQEASTKILPAIRHVLRGEIFLGEQFSPSILRRLLSGEPDEDEPVVARLSDRELQVFRLIGDGLGTQEIAGRLNLSVKTIETYQAHIKDKLGLRDARKLVQFAIRWALGRQPS